MTNTTRLESLVGGKFLLTGDFETFPRRRLVKAIKGCGGVVYKHGKASDGLTGVIAGDRGGSNVDLPEGIPVYTEADVRAATGLGLGANERMSMLRGALQEGASERAWSTIVTVLEVWEDERGVEDAIRYVADLAGEWPAAIRMAPPRWLKRAAQADALRLPLAGRVCISNGMLAPGQLGAALDKAPGVTHVDLVLRRNDRFDPNEFRAILGAVGPRLRELSIHFHLVYMVTRELVPILVSTRLPALETLRVRARWYPEGTSPLTPEQHATLERTNPGVALDLIPNVYPDQEPV